MHTSDRHYLYLFFYGDLPGSIKYKDLHNSFKQQNRTIKMNITETGFGCIGWSILTFPPRTNICCAQGTLYILFSQIVLKKDHAFPLLMQMAYNKMTKLYTSICYTQF